MLKASWLMLEIKEFRCCEVKIEESEKAGSHWESNPGSTPLTWATSALPLSHDTRTTTNSIYPAQVVLNASVAHLAVAGVLGLTPGDCWPFHFPLFSPYITSKFLYLLSYTFGTLYIHAWMVVLIPDPWSQSNKNLNCYLWPTTWCAYIKVYFVWPQWIINHKLYAGWFLIHPCALLFK